ncbi:MAG: hypothetical protein RLZZ505_1532 [Verrucomicrobiota bacterium]|jgi:predicted nucleic acid-binding protein
MNYLVESKGLPISTLDSQIAATAQRHNLAIVTRNVPDFQNTVLKILNPFAS